MTRDLPTAVNEHCLTHALGTVVHAEPLKGGLQSRVERLTTSTGATLVLKRHATAPQDWYALEAEGLAVLRDAANPQAGKTSGVETSGVEISGVKTSAPDASTPSDPPPAHGFAVKTSNSTPLPRVPHVYAVGQDFLLLEDFGAAPRATDYWERFGRGLATLHSVTHPTAGWRHDNWLGLTRQVNTPTASGAEFFVEHRVRRYLREPLTRQTLTPHDIAGVEKLCERILRETPPMPNVLCHGDLWTGNMMTAPAGGTAAGGTTAGGPAYLDPAVHYGLAEAELSLTRHFGGIPDSFYAAYQEINPLPDGWETRLRWFELKEMLGLISQFADQHDMVRPLRELIKRYV